jgi:hypothetical protein
VRKTKGSRARGKKRPGDEKYEEKCYIDCPEAKNGIKWPHGLHISLKTAQQPQYTPRFSCMALSLCHPV